MVAPFFDKGYAFVDLNSKQAVLETLRKGQSTGGKTVHEGSGAQVSSHACTWPNSKSHRELAALTHALLIPFSHGLARTRVRTLAPGRTLFSRQRR